MELAGPDGHRDHRHAPWANTTVPECHGQKKTNTDYFFSLLRSPQSAPVALLWVLHIPALPSSSVTVSSFPANCRAHLSFNTSTFRGGEQAQRNEAKVSKWEFRYLWYFPDYTFALTHDK